MTVPAFTLTPDDSPRVLVADHDRDTAAAVIRQAFAEGRLDDDEHERRADLVQRAQTRGDVEAAVTGIPESAAVDATPSTRRPETGLIGALLGALLLMMVAVAMGVGLSSPHLSYKEPTVTPAAAAAQVRADWREYVNPVVKAERAHFAKTGRYTKNWTTLALANRELLNSDTTGGVDIRLADGRRGAVLTTVSEVNESFTLTAALDDHGHIERRCDPSYGITAREAGCPSPQKARNR